MMFLLTSRAKVFILNQTIKITIFPMKFTKFIFHFLLKLCRGWRRWVQLKLESYLILTIDHILLIWNLHLCEGVYSVVDEFKFLVLGNLYQCLKLVDQWGLWGDTKYFLFQDLWEYLFNLVYTFIFVVLQIIHKFLNRIPIYFLLLLSSHAINISHQLQQEFIDFIRKLLSNYDVFFIVLNIINAVS